jgi:addiction module HigA family antidote
MAKKSKLPPVHPGEVLYGDFLKPLEMSQNELAREIRVPSSRITPIIKGRRRITPEMALRLGRFFRTGAEFWLGLQRKYDLQVAEDKLASEIERGIEPIEKKRLATASMP